MKKALRFVRWTALTAAGAAVLAVAYFGDIKWLQWGIAGAVAAMVIGRALQAHEVQREADRDQVRELLRRMGELEHTAAETHAIVIAINSRLREHA